ncbi:hypothetical protein [Amycolatopsis tolypomycina]|uniref:Uncharacterized protein n=1 Tax=Amycolatopsis tolypomycina TaxID=208445 RepID=A0A1H4PEL0_9PSEU|nr:hypothetical protein [Amycolatopsis tolypomycina]SEC05859.1 hypothetical protein SAMN04489727_2404 [Amycolatopsis tolypomycina]
MTLIEDTRARLGAIGAWLPSAPLAPSPDVVLGTGVANLRARRGMTTQKGDATPAQAHPGRFALDIGAGHAFPAAKLGEDYRPLDRMRADLSEIDTAVTETPAPVPFPRVPAAPTFESTVESLLDLAVAVTR